jgi:phosphoglucosamine mutase
LPDEVELAIEAELEKPMQCVSSEHLGKARRLRDANGRYIEFCKSTFPSELDLRGLKIVVDCAHGAAYDIAPHVFHELGAEVLAIGNAPNGLNINDKVGATAPEALAIAVRANHADLGIALDGDADRLVMVDRHGVIYDGDQLLYLMVLDRLAVGPVAGAVGTLMTNMAVEIAFKELGSVSPEQRSEIAMCLSKCENVAGYLVVKGPDIYCAWINIQQAMVLCLHCRCYQHCVAPEKSGPMF